MKQHITEKQLDELGAEAQHKLSLWLQKKQGLRDDVYPSHNSMLLSIGQMIEYLDEHGTKENYIDSSYENVLLFGECGYDNVLAIGYNSEELCDALWEATKGIIKPKKKFDIKKAYKTNIYEIS